MASTFVSGIATAVVLVAMLLAGCSSTTTTKGRVGTPAASDETSASMAPGEPAGVAEPPTAARGGGGKGKASTKKGSAGPGAGSGAGTAAVSGPRGELSIGVLYSRNTAAQEALGVHEDTSLDALRVAKALVAHFNKHGGMVGRQLAPVYHVFGADDPSYEIDLQAACSDFTQDHHVAVVLDLAGAWDPSFQQCLQAAKVPYFGGVVSDDEDMRRFPGMAHPSDRSLDDRVRTVIDVLSDTRYLSASNKIGVIIEGCPNAQRAFQRALLPATQRRGLHVTSTFEITCITGFASAGPGAQQLQQAVLKFKTENVDRVTFVSNYESAAILLFATEAESAGYRPGYALSSNAGPSIISTSVPAEQAKQFTGVGWQPNFDTADSAPIGAAGTRCRQITAAEGATPSSARDAAYIDAGCEAFFLLETVLGTTHAVAEYGAMLQSIDGLAAGFQSPLALDGATQFAPGRHAGAAHAAPFGYNALCSCIRYSGPARRHV